jgi:uncharacterized protein YegL
MSDFSTDEAYPVFPVFLLVDVSGSMAGPAIEEVNKQLPELKEAIKGDPTVGEIARVGLITFGQDARVALSLCDVAYADLPNLRADSPYTDFGAAFTLARREIEDDIRALGRGTRFHKPVIFFLSDGQYNPPRSDSWQPAYKDLTDKEWKFNPEIVAIGFGQADQEEIQRIATTHAFFATDTDPAAAVSEIMQTIIGSIKVTSRSLRSGDAGGLIVQPSDPNKFHTLPILTVDDDD